MPGIWARSGRWLDFFWTFRASLCRTLARLNDPHLHFYASSAASYGDLSQVTLYWPSATGLEASAASALAPTGSVSASSIALPFSSLAFGVDSRGYSGIFLRPDAGPALSMLPYASGDMLCGLGEHSSVGAATSSLAQYYRDLASMALYAGNAMHLSPAGPLPIMQLATSAEKSNGTPTTLKTPAQPALSSSWSHLATVASSEQLGSSHSSYSTMNEATVRAEPDFVRATAPVPHRPSPPVSLSLPIATTQSSTSTANLTSSISSFQSSSSQISDSEADQPSLESPRLDSTASSSSANSASLHRPLTRSLSKRRTAKNNSILDKRRATPSNGRDSAIVDLPRIVMPDTRRAPAGLNCRSEDLAEMMTSAATLVHLKDLSVPLSLDSNRSFQVASTTSSTHGIQRSPLSGPTEMPCRTASPPPILESADDRFKKKDSRASLASHSALNFTTTSGRARSDEYGKEKEMLVTGVSAKDTVPSQLSVRKPTPTTRPQSHVEGVDPSESRAQSTDSGREPPNTGLKRETKEKPAGDGGVAHFGNPVRRGGRSTTERESGHAALSCIGGDLVESDYSGGKVPTEGTKEENCKMDVSAEDCDPVVKGARDTKEHGHVNVHRDAEKLVREGEERRYNLDVGSMPSSLIASAIDPELLTHSCPGAIATAPTSLFHVDSRDTLAVPPSTAGTLLRMESNARPGVVLNDSIEVLAFAATQKSLSPSVSQDLVTPLSVDLAEPETRRRRQHYELQASSRPRPIASLASPSHGSSVFPVPLNPLSSNLPAHYMLVDASTDSLSSSSSLSSRSTTLAEVEDDSDSEEHTLASNIPSAKRSRGKDATAPTRTPLEGTIPTPGFSSPAVLSSPSPSIAREVASPNNFASDPSRTTSEAPTVAQNLDPLLTSSASAFLDSTTVGNVPTSIKANFKLNPNDEAQLGLSSTGNSQSQTSPQVTVSQLQQQQIAYQPQFSVNHYGSQYQAQQSLPHTLSNPDMTAALSSVHPMFALGTHHNAYLASNSSMIHPMMAAATVYGYAQAQAQAQAQQQVDTLQPVHLSSPGHHGASASSPFAPSPSSPFSSGLSHLTGPLGSASSSSKAPTPYQLHSNGATTNPSPFAFPQFHRPPTLSSLSTLPQIPGSNVFDIHSQLNASASPSSSSATTGASARSVVFPTPTALLPTSTNALSHSSLINRPSSATPPLSSSSANAYALGSLSDGNSSTSASGLPSHLSTSLGAFAQSLPFGAAVMANGCAPSAAGTTTLSPSSPGSSAASNALGHGDWSFPASYLSNPHLAMHQYAPAVSFTHLSASSAAPSHTSSLLSPASFPHYGAAAAHAYAPFYTLSHAGDAALPHSPMLVSAPSVISPSPSLRASAELPLQNRTHRSSSPATARSQHSSHESRSSHMQLGASPSPHSASRQPPVPVALGPSTMTNGTLVPSDHMFAYAFRHANSDWALYNWHVRSGGRYIMTEHAYRRYFACDEVDCKALLYEDSPAPVPEPEDLEEMEYYLPEVRISIQRVHNHAPPTTRKPCPDLVSRAAFLMRTMTKEQARDILIVEAGNGIGIPATELIASSTEGPAPRRSRFGHGAKRSAHRTPSLLLQMLPSPTSALPVLYPPTLVPYPTPLSTLPSPTAFFLPSSSLASSSSLALPHPTRPSKPSSDASSASPDPSHRPPPPGKLQ